MTTTKPPTSTDILVYQYLQQYGKITAMQMYELFNTTSHRDRFFRLRKAGYGIASKMIHYMKDGKKKCYCEYSLGSEKNAA